MVHPLDRHSLDHLLFVPSDQLPCRSVHLQNHALTRSCLLDRVWPLIELHAPITASLAGRALAIHRLHPAIRVKEGGQRWARRQDGESHARGLVPTGPGRARTLMVAVVVIGRRHLPYLAHVSRAMDEQAFVLVTFMVSFDTTIFIRAMGWADARPGRPDNATSAQTDSRKSRPLALPTRAHITIKAHPRQAIPTARAFLPPPGARFRR
jgi:hypothetical protein